MSTHAFLVVVLLAIAGAVYLLQNKPASEPPSEPKVKAIVQDEPPPAVVPAPLPIPQPVPESIATELPAPISWYTARRVSVMTDVGVTSVPAGVEVSKISETEILYNGKRFTVKPGDLTSDLAVVADVMSRQDAAEALLQKERDAAAAAEKSNIAAVQSHMEDKKAGLRAQASAAIISIDRQISALRQKINYEREQESLARAYNRVSSRGAVITKCEQAIAKLEAERLRLSSMQ